MRLQDKTVVVTGASRGLGLAICEAFAAEGAAIAMLAKRSSHLATAADRIDKAIAIPCDVADPSQVHAAFIQIREQLGGIDALVNNAAVGRPQPIEESVDELAQLQVQVNLLGPLYCMREAIPMMRARGGGDIVNVTSEAVDKPYPYLGIYAATKSALETLSAATRTEVCDDHIRVAVYRSGRVTGSFSRDWDPTMMARARAAAKAAGFYERSPEAMPVELAAKEILELVLLDRSARIDLLKPGDQIS